MSVHSHAVAPESSGAFFLDMGTERCVFQAGGLRKESMKNLGAAIE